ncbi:rRNA maturation RNase YbeY [uncultured Aquimonas sp.]|uniref:rRNA maturation RNase YbeY n=1 Tax=uncultured Aquimonas sp. TaxID=385483 RepID=UPI00086E4899|nr:rRNA maturation RNase YbeY [uncultured Aquimonas sp.]ODU48187.1 MAG: rRNA maturation RNase YbeY [Xanthomonadaceae bacterium SCN 69-123]
MSRIDISYGLSRAGLPAAATLRAYAEAALAGRREDGELSVRIVDADEGRALNRDYRDKDYATNVLSFPAELPPGVPLPILGDLVLCAPVVAREAEEQGKPLKHHYAHMLVHGVLHLLGHDHMDEAEAEAMETIEREVLAGLGIPDPYA